MRKPLVLLTLALPALTASPLFANLDATYRPFAQSIFVVSSSGVVQKEEKIDVHAVAVAGGFSYRF
jgi:hypothetical protein